jgi:hypothetical protein
MRGEHVNEIFVVICLYSGTLPPGVLEIATPFSPLPVGLPADLPSGVDVAQNVSFLSQMGMVLYALL